MIHEECPITAAVRVLRQHKINFKPFFYRYQEHGGTRAGAAALGLPEHTLIKTLVMETDRPEPLIVLMHGDCEVSAKQLARILGVKAVVPCDERTATRLTGYQLGGTSPFGTRTTLPIYAEKSIFDLPTILINGGKRGFLVEIVPQSLCTVFPVTEVEIAIRR